jgi:hypothetical protein
MLRPDALARCQESRTAGSDSASAHAASPNKARPCRPQPAKSIGRRFSAAFPTAALHLIGNAFAPWTPMCHGCEHHHRSNSGNRRMADLADAPKNQKCDLPVLFVKNKHESYIKFIE